MVLSVRAMRQAIAPRFAIKTLLNMFRLQRLTCGGSSRMIASAGSQVVPRSHHRIIFGQLCNAIPDHQLKRGRIISITGII